MSVADIEARRAARRAALEQAREKQLEIDLAALDAAEEEHGCDRVVRIDATAWQDGLATLAVFRMPTAPEMRRFQDQTKTQPNGKPGNAVAAGEQLARVCLLYPTREAYEAMCEASALHNGLAGGALATKAIGAVADEGKG